MLGCAVLESCYMHLHCLSFLAEGYDFVVIVDNVWWSLFFIFFKGYSTIYILFGHPIEFNDLFIIVFCYKLL